MLRTVFLVTAVLVIALVGGAGSVWLMLEQTRSVGSVDVGAWTAFPKAGTPEADPYSRARAARLGELSLGQAEGIVFVADQDDAGVPLQRQCSYRITGSVPPVRFFTLYAADQTRRILPAPGRFRAALHSRELLWSNGDAVEIGVGPHAEPGNWLPVSGSGQMLLILTLFDTPVSTGRSIEDIPLPSIEKTGCDV